MTKYLLLVALVTISVNCGAGGESSSPTSPTPQAYTQTVTGTVSSLGVTEHALSIPRTGNMTLLLSWGTGADLDLYLTNSTCASYPPTNCGILASSDGLTATERIVRSVTANESFKVWVDNFTSSPQSYSISITIQ